MRAGAWTRSASAVVSWAGMRGVVTLAAALLLPKSTPHVEQLRLAAFVVVAGTLLVQGTTLPWLVRRLGLPAPDAAEDALQSAALVTEAARAGLVRLDEVRTPADPDEVIELLRQRAERRTNASWERLGRSQSEMEPPTAVYRRLRLQMLDAERESILNTRKLGTVDEEILRGALTAVDIEESLLDRVEDAQARPDVELQASSTRRDDLCAHLALAPLVVTPLSPGVCADCLREGTRWVHLRLCLTCGNVGCCDSSVSRHAARHFQVREHAVMRSIEPGEAWRWCYVDEQLG
jgi:CPA1 family monovalent cation:H+ antiporter